MTEFSAEEPEATTQTAVEGEVLDSSGLSGGANLSVAGRVARRSAIAASAAVIGLASVAAAATGSLGLLGEEEPAEEDPVEDEDTVLNFGYDGDLHLLVWNTSSTEGDYDCSLEKDEDNPAYGTQYGVAGGEISVDALTVETDEGTEDVTFPARDEESDDVAYADSEDCMLDAAEVAGPNGQINHGTFMSLFNSLYEGTGRGCVNRYLAQSDLGKGDQQLQVSDVDPEFLSVDDGDEGEVTFSTVLADCERGKDKENSNGNGNGHRPDTDEGGASEADAEVNGNGNGRGNSEDKGNGKGKGKG